MYTIDDFSKMAGLPQQTPNQIKITADGFVWKLINKEKAEKILMLELFEIYTLYNDESESLILNFGDIEDAFNNGDKVGIPVGHIR